MTRDIDNVGSGRIIEWNGGVLENGVVPQVPKPTLRLEIALDDQE